MSVKVRIRCHYIDCKFLDRLYCGAEAVEIDPEKFCRTYIPLEEEQIPEEDLADDEADELEDEDEISWDDLEEDDDLDDVEPGY